MPRGRPGLCRLARNLEPRAPRPELRFEALRKLAEAGLSPGISIAPLLPMINDSEASIDAVAQAAKAAGVTSISGGLLFLKPTTRMVFLPWLEANFPHLLARYLDRYASGAFLHGEYADFIRRRIEGVRRRYDFQEDPRMHRHHVVADESQLKLFS